MWARIHHSGMSVLVHVAGALTGIKYRDEILQHHVIPHMNFNDGMFQRDNARPSVAHVRKDCLGLPIQNTPSLTLPQLLTALQREWQNITHTVQRSRASVCHTYVCAHVLGGFQEVLFRTYT